MSHNGSVVLKCNQSIKSVTLGLQNRGWQFRLCISVVTASCNHCWECECGATFMEEGVASMAPTHSCHSLRLAGIA